MEWLGLSSEFWAAIIGAIVGGIVSASAAGLVTVILERRRSRLEDLMRVQKLVEDYAQWVVKMSVSPAKTVDNVDELDTESSLIAFRAKTLLSRIDDPKLTTLSTMVFGKSVELLRARNANEKGSLGEWRDKVTAACAVLTDELSLHIGGKGGFKRLVRFLRKLPQR